MSKPLRQATPWVTSIIDDFRDNWPESGIVESVKAGIDGQPTFWAKENGQEIGTRAPHVAERAVALSDTIIGPLNATAARSRKS